MLLCSLKYAREACVDEVFENMGKSGFTPYYIYSARRLNGQPHAAIEYRKKKREINLLTINN